MIRTEPSSVAHVTPFFRVATRLGAALFTLVQAGCIADTAIAPTIEPAVATSLAPHSSATLSYLVGAAVSELPSVIVWDQRGAGMRGVTVTFAVGSGGGSVTGGSALTNSVGIATVGSWILGASPGPNTLTASATGLPSVTFEATGIADPRESCSAVLAHELGTTTNGSLALTDCMSDGVFIDSYSTTLSGVDAYVFRQSATFDTFLYLSTNNGKLIAYNNNESSATTNSAIKALLPRGSYLIGATSLNFDVTGAYSLSSQTTSTEVSGCEEVYVVQGVSTTQNIQTTDCQRTNGPVYADQFLIYLERGQSLTLTMASTAVDSFLELYFLDPATGSRTLVRSNDNADTSGTRDALLVYPFAADGYYAIMARTALNGQTGGYTLGIQ